MGDCTNMGGNSMGVGGPLEGGNIEGTIAGGGNVGYRYPMEESPPPDDGPLRGGPLKGGNMGYSGPMEETPPPDDGPLRGGSWGGGR